MPHGIDKEAVAPPRIRADERRVARVVAQCDPDLSDQRVQSTIDIDIRLRPQFGVQLFARDEFALTADERNQCAHRLRCEGNGLGRPSQLECRGIDLEVPETDRPVHLLSRVQPMTVMSIVRSPGRHRPGRRRTTAATRGYRSRTTLRMPHHAAEPETTTDDSSATERTGNREPRQRV
jgi:hypothetical protein